MKYFSCKIIGRFHMPSQINNNDGEKSFISLVTIKYGYITCGLTTISQHRILKLPLKHNTSQPVKSQECHGVTSSVKISEILP
jgi:hypothetical protein